MIVTQRIDFPLLSSQTLTFQGVEAVRTYEKA